MVDLPKLKDVASIRTGSNPQLEAWLYHFLTENNVEYSLNPSMVASPAQLAFMVALQAGQVYVPCSDEYFFMVYNRQRESLTQEYKNIWGFIEQLLRNANLHDSVGKRIKSLCLFRFQIYLDSLMILPSRLRKRLVKVVLTQCGIHDPFSEKKQKANAKAASLIASKDFQSVFCSLPKHFCRIGSSLPEVRDELDSMEILRLMRVSTFENLWKKKFVKEDLVREIEAADQSYSELYSFLRLEKDESKRILYIPDEAGGFMFDLMLIRKLLRQGHEVILALKEFFYFHFETMLDLEDDPEVKKALEDVYIMDSTAVSKNTLLRILRENRFIVISDGTSEQLNLYRTSVAFARAWKECDVVFAKGKRNRDILIGTSHQFTRDIVSFWRNEGGEFSLEVKKRAAWSTKFSEKALLGFAKHIIDEMRTAKSHGKSVMFYSAIIGSIPGETKTAIAVVTAFVNHLRAKLENTYIVNPAEHFIEGLDGDDLMYMWEHVQRSGLLDVWRFQTVDDIEASFALLGQKVPSVWSGKDSTFSTGCTKEMRIAIDVQKKHSELQIIGPSSEKFFRRTEYGVGKYYDASIVARGSE